MMYEIEFHRVGEGENSGDAICLRYLDGESWRIGVVDGGYEESGQRLADHVRTHYQTDVVDFVISTHPDNDHMSGLRTVLRELRVKELWMHVPWVHAAAIQHLFQSRRWQLPNLEAEIRRSYPHVQELLELSAKKATDVYEPFAGARIGPFTVLSPTKPMYEGLLPQFRDTPRCDQPLLALLGHWVTGVGRRVARRLDKIIQEDWYTETLREGGTTAAENESSVVLLGHFGDRRVLLTGDAGLVALRTAKETADTLHLQMARPHHFQLPHHGSRNNISPSALNFIVGPPVEIGISNTVQVIVSAGALDSHHPRQVVVNALERRGCKPWSTKNHSYLAIRGNGMPGRESEVTSTPLAFDRAVEAYDS
jgi:beta-lactamase superfamily II metal-dependent hydrolase